MTKTRAWIEPLARSGYAARGIVYLVIGFFAALAAFGGGETKSTKGALHKVIEQPFGTVLIWLMIVGLAGYVTWRLIQSVFDPDDHGWTPKGLAVRAGLLASAFTYSTLAAYALSMAGVFSGGGGASVSRPIADTLDRVVGLKWVSLGLAMLFLGVAGAHFWKAITRKYAGHFRAGHKVMRFVHPVSIVGLCARGIIFVIIAILLLYRFGNAAASSVQPPGLKDAMIFVQDLPFGRWLFALMGVGLIAFSAYSLFEARWRRINVEEA